MSDPKGVASKTLIGIVALFNVAPLVVVIGTAFSNANFLEFPPRSFSLRWFAEITGAHWVSSFAASLSIAFVVATVTTAVCFCVAIGSVRSRAPGRGALDFGILSPLLFPHAAVALVLFGVVQAAGLLGTSPGIAFAHLVVAIPIAYQPIVRGVRQIDASLEEAAMALGANKFQAILQVTLPLVKPALIASFLFTFLISFDETTVTLFLTGSGVITLPVAILFEVEDKASPIVSALSAVLIILTVFTAVACSRFITLQELVRARRG